MITVMASPSTNYEPVLEMLRQGTGPAEIIETLGLTITKRQVQRIAKQHGIARQHDRGGRLDEDSLGVGPLRGIVEFCLIQHLGLDPYVCSDCGRRFKKKCDIHHTKYDGATIYDLVFLCRRCNLAPRNVGLL
jgi:hypothetical protein